MCPCLNRGVVCVVCPVWFMLAFSRLQDTRGFTESTKILNPRKRFKALYGLCHTKRRCTGGTEVDDSVLKDDKQKVIFPPPVPVCPCCVAANSTEIGVLAFFFVFSLFPSFVYSLAFFLVWLSSGSCSVDCSTVAGFVLVEPQDMMAEDEKPKNGCGNYMPVFRIVGRVPQRVVLCCSFSAGEDSFDRLSVRLSTDLHFCGVPC